MSSWERCLALTIPLSTRGCNSLQYVPQLESYNTIQYISQLEVAMLYNTSLNSKLQYLKVPLSIQSYYALQCLSQLEVTIPYNTGACLTCSSLLLSLCFLVVCPDKKENVFHSDECGEGEWKFYNTLQYLSQLSSIEPNYSFVLSAQDVLHSLSSYLHANYRIKWLLTNLKEAFSLWKLPHGSGIWLKFQTYLRGIKITFVTGFFSAQRCR